VTRQYCIARPTGRARIETWGNARDWRILTPAGAAITAAEVEAIPGNQADPAYLQALTREQAGKLAGSALSLAPEEAQLVRVALAVLLRELPAQAGRRACRVKPAMLVRAA